MPGIGVVLNPRSRRNQRDPKAALRLAQTLGDQGVVREARSRDELRRIAEDFMRLEIDVLGISGGDGTNHVTISGFVEVYGGAKLPRLALLRGGTMNTVANAVGVRREAPEGLLGHLLRAYAERKSRPLPDVERHVLRVAPTADAGRATYGFLFGTGVVAGFLSEYYRAPVPSPASAAKTLARGVGSALVGGPTIRRMAAPFRGAVHLDDGTVWEERDYLSVAAGTIDQIGLRFRPFRRFAERPGAFHVLGIFASPLALVGELPRIWRAEPMRPDRTYEATPSGLTLRPASGALEYMIDGDLHRADGDLRVDIGPRVKILVVS